MTHTIEVRRHSRRGRGGQRLTQWGVALAREVGEHCGPFDRVVTSPLARCVETAVAMGFAVDEVEPRLAGADGLGETFPGSAEVDWSAGYGGMARLIAEGGALAMFARQQATLWQELARGLPEGGRLLIVTHGGGFLDGAAIACLPQAAHATWGATSRYCEGVRLTCAGDTCLAGEVLRVAQGEPV